VRSLYAIHIVAGSLGLLSGYVALFAGKGAAVHRGSGMVFVYTMLAMAVAGFTIAVTRGVAPTINVPAALLTSYLVITSLTTVRPLATGARAISIGGTIVALGVGVTMLALGIEGVVKGGTRSGAVVIPFFMFGVVGLVGGIGDIRVMRAVPLRGTARLARHLWRMCFALFIAALSFFIGQAKVIPEPLRIRPLLGLPVLVVLATMFYWVWRVRVRHSLRGIVRVSAAA
jgi:uncharacterized membrane protein